MLTSTYEWNIGVQRLPYRCGFCIGIVSGFQSSNFLHSFISSYWMKHIYVKLDHHLEVFFKFPYQWRCSFGGAQRQQWAILFIWKYLRRERYDSCCQLPTCCCITLKMAELMCRKLECSEKCTPIKIVFNRFIDQLCLCVPVFLHNLWIPSVILTKFFYTRGFGLWLHKVYGYP